MESDQEGDEQIRILIKNCSNEIFTNEEKEFILSLINHKYKEIPAAGRIKIRTLIGWIRNG